MKVLEELDRKMALAWRLVHSVRGLHIRVRLELYRLKRQRNRISRTIEPQRSRHERYPGLHVVGGDQ